MIETTDNQNYKFFVSVIIPVFNDSKRLALCLLALENQSHPRNLYEIVVVDNGSTDDISQTMQKYSNVKFCYESKRGSYTARNTGIANSTGDIVAFTDSDCIPATNWLEMGVKSLCGDPKCGLIGGKIELFYNNPSKLSAVELWESLVAFNQKSYVNNKYAATANAFTFRSVINEVGNFNKELVSSGDVEWGRRVFASGYNLIYSDNTVVYHPARRTFKEFYTKETRIVSGHYKLNLIDCSTKALLLESIKPIITINRFLNDPNLKEIDGIMNKFKVVSVMVSRRYIRVWQVLKLKFSEWFVKLINKRN